MDTSLKAPWENGLKVNLLAMIRFLAHIWVRGAATFQKFIDVPTLAFQQDKLNEIYLQTKEVHAHCNLLGLALSANKAAETLNLLDSGRCNPDALRSLLSELQSRIKEELEAEWFKYVPRYKAQYIEPGAFDTPELRAFGWDTQIEFARAGECFALGLHTATVFHLMRIVDSGLKAAAKSLGIAYASESWKTVSDKIQAEMEKKYRLKTDEWKKTEPFYAGLLTDIGAIGKAHRNPALHDLKVNYSEDEAHYLFTVTQAFIVHLAIGGLHET